MIYLLWLLASGAARTIASPQAATYEVSTLAGSGAWGFVDGAGTDASFNNPWGVATSPDGSTVYVADFRNHKVRAINVATGEVSTLAGSGYHGSVDGANGYGVAAARFNFPSGVAVSSDDSTVYVADYQSHKIRAINVATGYVSTLAGSGVPGSANGVGTAASFNWPTGVAVSSDGSTVYVADSYNNKVRAINVASGYVSTLAGSGASGSADGAGTAASFNSRFSMGVAVSSDGSTVYVADRNNNKVRAINVATGYVSTLAGSGASGSADGAGAAASFNWPYGVAASPDGSTVYVADRNNHKLRAINVASGAVSTLAGSGLQGSVDGAGADASFLYPRDVAASPDGSSVYVADWTNNKVREVSLAPSPAPPASPPAWPPSPSPPPPSPPPPSPSPPPTAIKGDPITTFQGQETRYWLSMEHFTPVFEQGPLALSQLAGPANPPPGLENHKGAWVMATELNVAGLDSILIETVDPTTLLAQPNATAPPVAGALTTMRLSFVGKQLKAGEHKLSVSDMTIAVSAKADPDQKIGRGFVEKIDIKAEGLHLRITSSKANKFADETLQVLGLHLDVQFLSFEQDKVRGALPEMWGLQPMSKETKLLLEKPAGF